MNIQTDRSTENEVNIQCKIHINWKIPTNVMSIHLFFGGFGKFPKPSMMDGGGMKEENELDLRDNAINSG